MPERTWRVDSFITAAETVSEAAIERRAKEGKRHVTILRKLDNFPPATFGSDLRLFTLGQISNEEFQVLQRILVEEGLDDLEINYVRLTLLKASMPEIKGESHPYVSQHDSLTVGEVRQLLNYGVYNHADSFTIEEDPYQTGIAVLQRILS